MFTETLYYIKKHILKHIIILSVFFIFSTGVGIFYAKFFTVDAATFFQVLSEEFSNMSSIGPVTTFLVIFFNNTIKTFVVLLFGVFLGILPLLFVFTNGFILGVIGYFFYSSAQLGQLALGILPHGILEIPAFIVGSAMGLHLGIQAFRWLTKQKNAVIGIHIRRAINIFTHVLLPLFLLAALIETFITTLLLHVVA